MTGKNTIGFNLSSSSERTFQTFNPVTGDSNPTFFFEATFEEADVAVLLAQKAFLLLKNISLDKRASFLEEIAVQITELGNELIQMYCLESGLSEQRAITERSRTIFQLNSFAKEILNGNWIKASIDEADSSSTPIKPDLRKMMIGLGPVVVFGASNFPLAYSTAGGDTASALAAGCPVIVKSHPMHAGTGELVAQAITRAAKKTEMPDGIFSNLNAQGFEIGRYLVQHAGVKAVGFTGSLKGGRALFDLANHREFPIPVFAEMGSVNPIVILPQILPEKLDLITSQLATSITNDAGQFCTKPGIVITVKSEFTNQFVSELKHKVNEQVSFSMLNPSILERFEERKKEILSCDIHNFSETEKLSGNNIGRQTIVVVDTKQFLSQQKLHDEVFGPLSIVVLCDDLEGLNGVISSFDGQLTMSIFGTDAEIFANKNLVQQATEKVGRVIFNGVPTGVTVGPSMNHGGPYPATTDARFTAVGIDAMQRFLRPVTFQNCPPEMLPAELRNMNSLCIPRRINGEWTRKDVHKKA
jgi:NADP-dependent aldehyde dehydrogenase